MKKLLAVTLLAAMAAFAFNGANAAKAADPVVKFNVTNTHSGKGVQDSTMDLLIKLADE